MAYKIILEDRAIAEIDHIFDWYENQRSGKKSIGDKK